jgi:hypothetical protein
MRTALTAAALLVVLAPAARADGVYFSESFGPGTIGDELSQRIDAHTFRFKAALGMRTGDWAIEPFIAGDITDQTDPFGSTAPDFTSYGIDVKRLMKVSAHVSVYVRGSMSAISTPDDAPCCVLYDRAPSDLYGYSGRGLGVGVGAQLSGKVSMLGLLAWPLFFTNIGPKMNAGLFIEDSYDYYRLHPTTQWEDANRRSIDASITRFTIGFAVGSDF